MLCPFCKNEVNVGATVCGCGAEEKNEVHGWVDPLKRIVLGPAFIICFLWLVFALQSAYTKSIGHGSLSFEDANGWLAIAVFIGLIVLWRRLPSKTGRKVWVR